MKIRRGVCLICCAAAGPRSGLARKGVVRVQLVSRWALGLVGLVLGGGAEGGWRGPREGVAIDRTPPCHAPRSNFFDHIGLGLGAVIIFWATIFTPYSASQQSLPEIGIDLSNLQIRLQASTHGANSHSFGWQCEFSETLSEACIDTMSRAAGSMHLPGN